MNAERESSKWTGLAEPHSEFIILLALAKLDFACVNDCDSPMQVSDVVASRVAERSPETGTVAATPLKTPTLSTIATRHQDHRLFSTVECKHCHLGFVSFIS
jgi:hypothetical protein